MAGAERSHRSPPREARWLSHGRRAAAGIGRNPREVRRDPVPVVCRGGRLWSGLCAGGSWFRRASRRCAPRRGSTRGLLVEPCRARSGRHRSKPRDARREPVPRPSRGQVSGCLRVGWFRRELRRCAPWRGSTHGRRAPRRFAPWSRWLSHVGRGAADIGRNPREGVQGRGSGLCAGGSWFRRASRRFAPWARLNRRSAG